jgi:hypothetical protein
VRASKAELALYGIGGITLLGAFGMWLGYRKSRPGFAYPQMFIFSGGLLGTAGVMSIHRKVTQPKSLSGGFGLAEVRQVRRGDVTQRLWHDKEMGLPERVQLLQGLKAKSIDDPDVRRLALAIVGPKERRRIQVGRETVTVEGANCVARDDKCELEAIFKWTSNPNNLRYTGDVGPTVLHPGAEPEAVDFFATVRRAIEQRGEDCDGHAVVNATLATLNGFHTRYRITSNTGASWDHIYALAGLPKNNPKKWVAMDTTLPKPKLGREPHYAKYVDFEA